MFSQQRKMTLAGIPAAARWKAVIQEAGTEQRLNLLITRHVFTGCRGMLKFPYQLELRVQLDY